MSSSNNFSHKLMENNITTNDLSKLIKFLKKNPRLTNGKQVKAFEKKWSKWLGCKYSTFVNSGSSANLISLNYLKYIGYKKGEVIVSSLNWVSDIASIIQCGFKPVFVDIDINNLAPNIDQIKSKINKNTIAIVLTHILGFNGLSNDLIKIVKKRKLFLIEDVCESHGAKFNDKKLGNFGNCSNFSFYFAHHMSTIEGGMVSTNDKNIYEFSRIIRSHGMNREHDNLNLKKKNIKKFSNLNKDFIFLYPSYNLRSTEINAVLGQTQLSRLNKNINIRNKNFKYFIKNLDSSKYFTKFDLEGISNYALLVLLNKNYQNNFYRDKLEKKMNKYKIEFRRGMSGGGNQLLQPYLSREIKKQYNKTKFRNVDSIHHYGYYIGNYPTLKKQKILKIVKILNSI